MFEIFSNWSISIFFLLTVLKLAFVDIKVKVRKYPTLNLDYFKDYLKETCLLVILVIAGHNIQQQRLGCSVYTNRDSACVSENVTIDWPTTFYHFIPLHTFYWCLRLLRF